MHDSGTGGVSNFLYFLFLDLEDEKFELQLVDI